MPSLIRDLLTYSRLGRQEVNKQPADCNELVAEVIRNLGPALQESQGVVNYDGLPTVPADRLQLLQVFQNLIGNAIKFRGSKAPIVRVESRRQGRFWEFTVSDNGIGIARQYVNTVFVIFKRLHTQAEYPGSGMGLAICKKIVERHGGRISVDSAPGRGSNFRFTLPVHGNEVHPCLPEK